MNVRVRIEHTWDVLDDLPQVGALGRTHGRGCKLLAFEMVSFFFELVSPGAIATDYPGTIKC